MKKVVQQGGRCALPRKAIEARDDDPLWLAWLAYLEAQSDRMDNGEDPELQRWLDDGGK